MYASMGRLLELKSWYPTAFTLHSNNIQLATIHAEVGSLVRFTRKGTQGPMMV